MSHLRESKALRSALERIEHGALVGLVALVSRLRPEAIVRVGAALGAAYGKVAAALGTRDDTIARANLALAFPELGEAAREDLLRRMWRNAGRLVADIALLDRWSRVSPGRIRELVTLDPLEGIQEMFARARERGSLVLTAHFGSFELLHAGCAAHGFPISLVHRTLPVLVREGESHRHRAVFLPEIPIARSSDRDADVIENSLRFNAVLESMIRAHPDHWIWMYRRWPQPSEPAARRDPGRLVERIGFTGVTKSPLTLA